MKIGGEVNISIDDGHIYMRFTNVELDCMIEQLNEIKEKLKERE